VLLAIVGALAAMCCLGGAAAAYIVERGIPDVLPTDLSHRPPRDPCALLGKEAFGSDLGGPLESSRTSSGRDQCDYAFQADAKAPADAKPALRLVVHVSAEAAKEFGDARKESSRIPVQCGSSAYAAHTTNPTGQIAEAWLWCLQQDVYLTLHFKGYSPVRWNGLVLDELMANLGRVAIGNVPKA
jgi:hypothetical protein